MAQLSDVGKIFSFVSDAHTLGDIVLAFFGKDRGTIKDGKSKSWFSGLFDDNDEVVVSICLAELMPDDEEGVHIFLRFLNSKFPHGKTWPERISNFRTRNAFMHFIVNHGNTPPVQHKIRETTKTDKNGVATTTIEWGTVAAGENKSLEFIKRCIATIRSEPTETKGRNKLLKELMAINAPTPSKSLIEIIETAVSITDDTAKLVDVASMKRVRNLQVKKNPIRRLFDSFL